LAILLLAFAACSPLPSNNASPGPSDPVAKADAKLFAGDYDGAEAAYDRLLQNDHSPRARAHHAVLLDYLDRFGDAADEARAAAAGASDAETLAYATRALDWAEDLPAAIAVGSRAISAKPDLALAHVYYSEVLSDVGRYGDARSELLSAEKRGGDAYVRAEVEREWANYYRGKGDRLEELNHLQLSVKIEPDFAERSFELARYYFGIDKADAAEKLLAAMRQKHPRSYWTAVLAGDTGLLSRSGQALPAFQAASKIRPTGLEASLGIAEIEIAMQRDFDAAHTALAAALKAHPDSAAAAGFLYWLDTLVLKADGVHDVATITGTSDWQPGRAGSGPRKSAVDAVNGARAGARVAAIAEDARLDQAAEAHGYFFLFNFGDPSLSDVGIHTENPQLPGFIGVDGGARAAHFGYDHPRVSEVISHSFLPQSAVANWINSVYHRFPLLSREALAAGYGQAQIGALTVQVMEFGAGPPGAADTVVYPADGQTGVAAEFRGGEIPDPVPGARYPVGYPISLAVGAGQALAVTQAALAGPDGKEVPVARLLPGNSSLEPGQFAMLAGNPLSSGKYTVSVAATVDGKPANRTWSFEVSDSH
jgi:tetratricopeptide (TPR) repeat protein